MDPLKNNQNGHRKLSSDPIELGFHNAYNDPLTLGNNSTDLDSNPNDSLLPPLARRGRNSNAFGSKPATPPGQRSLRATSLSLPKKSVADAFGPGLFSTRWEPPQAEDTVASTLNYLQMDDNEPPKPALFHRASSSVDYSSTIPFVPSRGRSFSTSYQSDFLEPPMTTHRHRPSIPEVSWEDIVQPNYEVSPNELSPPSKSLWVGNFDSTVSSNELFSLFLPFGTIESLRVLPDKDCAFINFKHLEEALKAKNTLHNSRVGNCIIKVGFSRPDSDTDKPTKSIYLGNLVHPVTQAELEAVFNPFGPVESIRLLPHKNCAFINFVLLDDAIKAKTEMQGKEIAGSVVKLGFAKAPNVSPDGSPNTEKIFYQGNGNTTPSTSPWGQLGNGVSTSSPSRTPTNGIQDEHEDEHVYATSIPPIPDPNPSRKVDQSRLREIRKKLESPCSVKEMEAIFLEIIDDAVELSYDYIGNVVIQKVIERCTEAHKLKLIEKVGPYLATLGTHKNGTWAAQKIIECAKTASQIQVIVNSLRPYTPPLLLDQFGNYVVQCCLRLAQKNQFIYDAICVKTWEVGQGRFGARAIRTCLESTHTTPKQKKQVSSAIVRDACQLACNPNGSILVSWVMETSGLPSRYKIVAQSLATQIVPLANHKLGSLSLIKIVSQNIEPEAKDFILKALSSQEVIVPILLDHNQGVLTIQKMIASISKEDRVLIGDAIRKALRHKDVSENHPAYKRLLDDLYEVPSPDKFPTPSASPAPHTPPREANMFVPFTPSKSPLNGTD